jgi:hypothetical protein
MTLRVLVGVEASPLFSVSVADKGLSWVNFEGDGDGQRVRANGLAVAGERVDFNAECTEFAEKEGIPHPGCFL